jgi:uncharacterized protein with PIN domain
MQPVISDGRRLPNLWCNGVGLEIVADHLVLDGAAVRCNRCGGQLFKSEFEETNMPIPSEADLRDDNFIILCANCLLHDD